MENSGEGNIVAVKERLPSSQEKWKNLLGEDSRKRIYESIAGDVVDIYEPNDQSLVDKNGFSIVSPDCFKSAFISPIREKRATKMLVPLNKIIALDTTKDINTQNSNPERLPWEIDSHTSVDEFRKLIKNGEFNFDDVNGLYGLELPGGYIIAIGGRHRITAMFLEGVSSINIQVNKIKDLKEFEINRKYFEDEIQDNIDSGKIKGRIEEDPDHFKKLILDKPVIESPLQLFGDKVSDELLDVLSQTLPANQIN